MSLYEVAQAAEVSGRVLFVDSELPCHNRVSLSNLTPGAQFDVRALVPPVST